MADHGQKWLDIAEIFGNCCNLLEMVDLSGMAELSGNGWKWQKWLEITTNCWKWLEIDRYG